MYLIIIYFVLFYVRMDGLGDAANVSFWSHLCSQFVCVCVCVCVCVDFAVIDLTKSNISFCM